GRVDAEEALEDALLVLRSDADAAVGDGDLHPAAAAPARHRHGRVGGRVGDGVLDEVGQGGDEQRQVTVHLEAGGPVDDDLDTGGLRGQAGPGQRLLHDLVDLDDLQLRQP